MPRKNDPSEIKIGSGLADSDSVEKNALVQPQSGSIEAHLEEGVTHEASSVSIDGYPPLYKSRNVEGALDELSALIPPEPPTVGNFSELVTLSGIPDWGVLKLKDQDVRSYFSENTDGSDIYPYYFVAPESANENPPFTTFGQDPVTDSVFNVDDGTYTGGGEGSTHVGAYTRSGVILHSNRLFYDESHFVISGAVYPADRGVLALVYWAAGGTPVEFLSLSLEDRIPAAILLGQGILGSSSGFPCDGDPGGIFSLGSSGGSYDPFSFPGQASGQYNLQEIHTGTSVTSGPSPSADNTAGQVRLGTDPNAGAAIIAGGINILGGTTAAVSGGDDNNFFRYRLPYLADYNTNTGLIYTSSTEKPRYFTKPSIALNPGTDLTEAGNYPNFSKDYWTFQVARYRHRLEILNGSGATTLDIGNYLLVHFRTEAAFEEFALTGAAPAPEDLYSASLPTWGSIEDDSNIVAVTGETSESYHILRSKLSQDIEGVDDPTASASPFNEFDYTALQDRVQSISGIKYFTPRDETADGIESWKITDLDLEINGLWENTYRVSSSDYPEDRNPALISVSPFSFEESGGSGTHTPVPTTALVSNPSRIQRQRLEFALEDLFAGAPTPADTATASLSPDEWHFSGDETEPSFTTDGKLRLFFRRPLKNSEDPSTTIFLEPGIVLPPSDGKSILYHSSKGEFSDTPLFGNFFSGGSPKTSLSDPSKDIEERFLDESYRYLKTWAGVPSPEKELLEGPGLPSAPSPVEVPVRASTTGDPNYTTASWLQNNHHEDDLSSVGAVSGEAQVAGLPDRNPLLFYGVKNPKPSSGILIYPQTDYTTGFRPSVVDGDLSGPPTQYDYSGITGDVEYVRAFDASINQTVPVVGQTFFYLKIKGLSLEDFEYSPPGPGSSGIAIMVKVPGLTTWMDLGRPDGSGPSKQDVALDGAGCKVIGPETFDSADSEDGTTFCQVKVHTGPYAKLFEISSGTEIGFSPILVKVIIKDSADGKALNFVDSTPEDDPSTLRGLVGISVIDPS